jgi:hypothetical protein
MCMRLTLSAVLEMMFEPVAMEPVSDTMRTFGWVTSGLPTVGPRPNTRLSTPAGKISDASSPGAGRSAGLFRRLEHHGVTGGEGRAIFQATIISG